MFKTIFAVREPYGERPLIYCESGADAEFLARAVHGRRYEPGCVQTLSVLTRYPQTHAELEMALGRVPGWYPSDADDGEDVDPFGEEEDDGE